MNKGTYTQQIHEGHKGNEIGEHTWDKLSLTRQEKTKLNMEHKTVTIKQDTVRRRLTHKFDTGVACLDSWAFLCYATMAGAEQTALRPAGK